MSELLTEQTVQEILRKVPDPELGRSLGDLKMVSAVQVHGDQTQVQLLLPTHAYPHRDRLTTAVQQAIKARVSNANVAVDFTVKTKGKDSGGGLGLRVKNVVAVGSGKGGVGKSTVAASLAFGLQSFGAKVGLMDADVYGPSIPHMLGAGGRPGIIEEKGPEGQTVRRIEPITSHGLKVMSMGFFVDPNEAVVWRGPMLHGAITQFLKDTEWGELDYLIIDLPPGTGDVSLTLSQLLGLAGAVVVCTPQQVALLDAIKAVAMFRKVKIPVLGMVENMTGDIFGRGGVQQKAAELGVPFLGEIPMDSAICVNGDQGQLQKNFNPESATRPHLQHICQQIAMQIVKELMSGPALPTLEIL